MNHALAELPRSRPPAAILGRVQANGNPPGWPNKLPRGIVMANAEESPREIVSRMVQGVEAWKQEHSAQLGDMQTAFDDMQKKLAAVAASGSAGGGDALLIDPAYSRPFASWFRHGSGEFELRDANATGERARIQAAMSSGSNGNGGFLAPVEWDRTIIKALTSVSPLRTLCTVIETTGPGYTTLWGGDQWGSGWVGETAERPQTSTPQLSPITFRPGELYANPAITQQLLDDAAINVEQWLGNEVADTFAKQEAIAFVAGNGTNKPQGFLSYIGTGTSLHPGGEPDVTVSGSATGITGDSLLDLVYALGAPYRANASWLMNSASIGKVSKLKDGQGNYLWQPSFIAGQPPTLIGKPVYFEESMPDVGAGALPIAFGDWARFYVINDRTGTRVLRDPYTAKPYVTFYTTKRVGGGIRDPKAVRFLKVAAS